MAITFGHSKDHRPDLKQLLYILTVSDDGGVPLYFTTASGNVTDDTTHRETWDLLSELVGDPKFLYVADCKLATRENLQYIHNHNGRFVTILPRTRREDSEFRNRLAADPDALDWDHLYDTMNDDLEVIDRLRVCSETTLSSEGFRLLWFHSTRKAERDAASRARKIDRATKELAALQSRLASAKTRFRRRDKVEAAVKEILSDTDTSTLGEGSHRGNRKRDVQAVNPWTSWKGHSLRQNNCYSLSLVLDDRYVANRARPNHRRRFPADHQSV